MVHTTIADGGKVGTTTVILVLQYCTVCCCTAGTKRAARSSSVEPVFLYLVLVWSVTDIEF